MFFHRTCPCPLQLGVEAQGPPMPSTTAPAARTMVTTTTRSLPRRTILSNLLCHIPFTSLFCSYIAPDHRAARYTTAVRGFLSSLARPYRVYNFGLTLSQHLYRVRQV